VAERLVVERLGRVGYAEGIALQEARVRARRRRAVADALLLLEHPPTITLGRSARREHLLTGPEQLARLGIGLFEVARGGDVTYHGPGQLVGYPILDLAARGEADVHAYLRTLEALLAGALAQLGVRARTIAGWTGVFVDDARSARPRKIASIGVGLRGWVTYHGFALNVTLDPAEFGAIVPCGLHEVAMTSLARELGPAAPGSLWRDAEAAVAAAFLARFG
jgi:lipoate-protein ligase B